VTTAEWLSEKYPINKSKIESLELALDLAEKNPRNVTGDPQETKEFNSSMSFIGSEATFRLRRKVLRVKTEMILLGLADIEPLQASITYSKDSSQSLSELISKPQDLFNEVYNRYAIPSYYGNSNAVHSVADEISQLHNISPWKCRRQLVQTLLSQDVISQSKNTNVNISCSVYIEDEDEIKKRHEESYIEKIVYIISYYATDEGSLREEITFLKSYAEDVRPKSGITYRAKLRALHAILRIAAYNRLEISNYLNSDFTLEQLTNFTQVRM